MTENDTFPKNNDENRHTAKKCSKIAVFQKEKFSTDIYVGASISRWSIAELFGLDYQVEWQSEK